MTHARRPAHAARFPVLVTSRLQTGLGSLRRPRELALIRAALLEAGARGDFQVVHHSIQSNHVHLILEARSREALAGGMRGLMVRLARGLNRLWSRCGSVFADRFHARALQTPREVRHALVYVLQDARKHGIGLQGPDACSSGPWFDGWQSPVAADPSLRRCSDGVHPSRAAAERGAAAEERGLVGPLGDACEVGRASPRRLARSSAAGLLCRAWTWLLGAGWKRHGLIALRECPASA